MKPYYQEDELVSRVQSGEMSMLDYVQHHSEQWDAEYHQYCEDNILDESQEESAEQYLAWKDRQMTEAMKDGEL